MDNPSDFIARLYGGSYSSDPIFVCSLPNVSGAPGEPAERSILTRTLADIDGFAAKWDRAGRSTYFCVNPLRPDAAPERPGGSRRTKANVSELVTCHAETDLKSVEDGVDKAAILAAAMSLPCPPSVCNDSGRGLHHYWLLNEPLEGTPENKERIEALNGRLGELLAGDPVGDVCRLLRLPGTHNTKEGGWLDCHTVHARWEPRYELADLEEMVASTQARLRRKATSRRALAAASPDDNPFLAAAAKLGFKPPLDVERALDEMEPGNIHNTILVVSASMMGRGVHPDDIVAALLPEVERANLAAGGEWSERQARRDEAKILGMCAAWARKHPEVAERRERAPEPSRTDSLKAAEPRKVQPTERLKGDSPESENEHVEPARRTASGEVVQIEAHRSQRQKKQRQERPVQPDTDERVPVHIVLGTAVLEAMEARGEAILFTARAMWTYRDGLWSMETDGVRQWLEVQVETAALALRLDSSVRTTNEARAWIMRRPNLWRDDVPWDKHGKVPTRSGLVDPRTLEIEPARPDHYCTWRVEAEFDPAATCPWWERMLDTVFRDREPEQRAGTIATMQEVMGAGFIDAKSRGMSRALCLVGGANCGKSGLLEVLGGLFSVDPISAELDSLESSHGTMPFVRRAPWVLHEAFNQGRWHVSSTVKALITSEPIGVNVKNGPMVTVRYTAPVFWATNHPPQFRESTRAIVDRLLVVECRRVFNPRYLVGVAAEAARRGYGRPSALVLAEERPGVLLWALRGLQRALARGSIEATEEIRQKGEDMHRDGNLVATFVEECLEYDRDRRVAVPDFCAAFAVWYAEEKGEDRRNPSNEAVGKALTALADPRICIHPKEMRDNQRRYYGGVVLNEQGIAFWKRALESKLFEGKTASTTPADEPVNTYIPEGWFTRPSVARMRAASLRDSRSEGRDGSYDDEELADATVTDSSEPVTAGFGLSSEQPSPSQPPVVKGKTFF